MPSSEEREPHAALSYDDALKAAGSFMKPGMDGHDLVRIAHSLMGAADYGSFSIGDGVFAVRDIAPTNELAEDSDDSL